MTKHRLRHLTEHSIECLTCACANIQNAAARELLTMTDALSSAGVLAAVFIGDSLEHESIVQFAREAIREQRVWCSVNGPFRPSRCRTHMPASKASISSK
ncbi:MAG TPA: hypothetical protein VLV78_15200 [Thermoanaerobaculia bacterium]|nr:hypothetical protein [Thermoanaerobaculia bacterium]